MNLAEIHNIIFNASAAIEETGSQFTITVNIHDECPQCGENRIEGYYTYSGFGTIRLQCMNCGFGDENNEK
jgi:uncharacterized protein (DUF983 family)